MCRAWHPGATLHTPGSMDCRTCGKKVRTACSRLLPCFFVMLLGQGVCTFVHNCAASQPMLSAVWLASTLVGVDGRMGRWVRTRRAGHALSEAVPWCLADHVVSTLLCIYPVCRAEACGGGRASYIDWHMPSTQPRQFSLKTLRWVQRPMPGWCCVGSLTLPRLWLCMPVI